MSTTEDVTNQLGSEDQGRASALTTRAAGAQKIGTDDAWILTKGVKRLMDSEREHEELSTAAENSVI
jgi:hypothetical protein